ncbi:MAG TPA: SdpI family protein [Candidatus Portnoybacteria bacterium]|nr:SdpI family protein [Candidatus Portnoybacteria bacterium]
MKLYDKKEFLPIILIVMLAMVGAYLYPQLPELVPSHWGINGEVNGWTGRTFAVIFFPSLILGIYLLMSFFPLMDPHKSNIESFAKWYFGLKIALVVFLGALYLLTLYAALGYEVNVARFVVLGLAALFAFLGLALPNIKKNYMIGIRLPWTLHSEIIWEKTHKFGGRLFLALAAIIAVAAFLPGAWTFGILMTGIVLLLALLTLYSYWEYKKL